MIVIEVIATLYFIAYFIFSILLLLFFQFRTGKENHNKRTNVTPYVSVLVAARNEEKSILKCLEALHKLDYPEDRLEVLIGNDHSEDATEKIVKDYIKDKPNFRLINIGKPLGNAKGKANALAYLAKQATGDYFCITDADIRVPRGWAKALMSEFEKGVGTVSGVTLVDGKGLLAKLQNMEWAYAFANVQIATDLGFPVTAVGNNMAISKEAYRAVGGYEKIPFSVTEDYELFKQTLLKGYQFKNKMSKELLAISEPVTNFKDLLIQRRRWMQGAVNLPTFLVVALSLQAVFFLFLLIAFAFNPLAALVLWSGKLVLQSLLILLIYNRVGYSRSNLMYILVYELYSLVFSFLTVLNYFITRKVVWKGRIYE